MMTVKEMAPSTSSQTSTTISCCEAIFCPKSTVQPTSSAAESGTAMAPMVMGTEMERRPLRRAMAAQSTESMRAVTLKAPCGPPASSCTMSWPVVVSRVMAASVSVLVVFSSRPLMRGGWSLTVQGK